MGGLGIARPGIMMGKIKHASMGLCRFTARLGYLSTHVFIQPILSGTCREQQGNPSPIRREFAAELYDWMQIHPFSSTRLPDGEDKCELFELAIIVCPLRDVPVFSFFYYYYAWHTHELATSSPSYTYLATGFPGTLSTYCTGFLVKKAL
jgi:hypothetical protein